MLDASSRIGNVSPESEVLGRIVIDGPGRAPVRELCDVALRLGRPGSTGYSVTVDPDSAETSLITRSALDTSLLLGECLLWWSVGLGRMELETCVRFEDARLVATVQWPPTKHQTRRHQRIRLAVPTWIHLLETGETMEVLSCDLSVGGAALLVPSSDEVARMPMGTPIVLVAHLAGRSMAASAEVVRAGGSLVVGVTFTSIAAADEAALANELRTTELRAAR